MFKPPSSAPETPSLVGCIAALVSSYDTNAQAIPISTSIITARIQARRTLSTDLLHAAEAIVRHRSKSTRSCTMVTISVWGRQINRTRYVLSTYMQSTYQFPRRYSSSCIVVPTPTTISAFKSTSTTPAMHAATTRSRALGTGARTHATGLVTESAWLCDTCVTALTVCLQPIRELLRDHCANTFYQHRPT